jgi:hypothetical protein
MPINGAPSSAMTSGAKQSGTVEARFHQYQVVGRLKPSAQKGTRKSTIYKMNVFAPNTVVAKSRFWYYMSMLNRVKKANGEILQINEVITRCFAPASAPASFLRASQAVTRGLSLVSRARLPAGRSRAAVSMPSLALEAGGSVGMCLPEPGGPDFLHVASSRSMLTAGCTGVQSSLCCAAGYALLRSAGSEGQYCSFRSCLTVEDAAAKDA